MKISLKKRKLGFVSNYSLKPKFVKTSAVKDNFNHAIKLNKN